MYVSKRFISKRNTVGFNIRVKQECLSVPVLEQLSLTPTSRPATLVARQFFLSPGRLQIEMCLDRSVVYYGEKVAMHVVISNSSTRTIRKIKVPFLEWFHCLMPVTFSPRQIVQDLSSIAAVVHHWRATGANLRPGND